jgi:hypothetical protein
LKSFLPDQYYFSHKYSLCLNEYLANLIVFGEQNKVYSVPIHFKDKRHDEEVSQLRLKGKEIALWLEKNGYRDELEKMMLRTLYPALLWDLHQFVAEALECSEKARLTVTYALLRKPFRDDLFYLEWLLAKPRDFIVTFQDNNPTEYSLDKMLREDKVRGIVKEAVSKTAKKDSVDPDVIYDMRYNKIVEYSFDAMWNKALHLITTAKTHSTEHRNMNFIFSDDEDRAYQWRHIYSFLPVALDYAVDVAESLMYTMVGDQRPNYYVDFFHRELGFAVWSKEVVDWQDNPKLSSEMPNDLDDLHFACPKCNKVIDMQGNLARTLFLERKMKCPKCLRKISIESIVDKNGLRPHARIEDLV